LTAIPVFPVRAFHHGAIRINTESGIRGPKDLEGKKVGVNRGYTVTSGVWARGILEKMYGVDLSKITWVLSGDEHVAEYRPPENVLPLEPGKNIEDLLASGDLAAAIGIETTSPNVRPLIPDAIKVGLEALSRDGHYPINHLVVLRDELLTRHAGLAADVFDVFAESKRRYVERSSQAGSQSRPRPIKRTFR
jgi:4,5-dihydroxyphthalate decarboxylase